MEQETLWRTPRVLVWIGLFVLVLTNIMLMITNYSLRAQASEMQHRIFRLQAEVYENAPLRFEQVRAFLVSPPTQMLQPPSRSALTLSKNIEAADSGTKLDAGTAVIDGAPPLTLDVLRRRAFPQVPETEYSLIVFIRPEDCPVSLQEASEWDRLHREARDANNGRLAVLGIVSHPDREEGIKFSRQLGISFPVVIDTELIVLPLFGIETTPVQLLIDREGKIQAMAGRSLERNERFIKSVREHMH